MSLSLIQDYDSSESEEDNDITKKGKSIASNLEHVKIQSDHTTSAADFFKSNSAPTWTIPSQGISKSTKVDKLEPTNEKKANKYVINHQLKPPQLVKPNIVTEDTKSWTSKRILNSNSNSDNKKMKDSNEDV